MNKITRILSFILALTIALSLTSVLKTNVSAVTNPYPTSQTVGGVVTVPCTYYAWQQTYERLGIALPAWGNAINWYNAAANAGYSVGTAPAANSIAVWSISGHSYGHVAFVTAVNGSQMTINEGGRTDATGSGGIVNGQVLPSTVGSTWYGRTLIGFVYLNGGGSNIQYSSISAGNYFLKHNATGKFLSVDGGGDADQVNISVANFTGGSEQKLAISAASRGYKMRPHCTSRLVNPYGVTVSAGLNVSLWPDVADVTEWWGFEKAGSGYIIRNMQNQNCVLAVNGTNVVTAAYTGYIDQIWTLVPPTVTVTYNANGGSGGPGTKTIDYGSKLTISSTTPTRTGYTFKGWGSRSYSTSPSYHQGWTYTFTEDTTLYAIWEINTYTVTYDANGGSGAPSQQTKTYGQNLVLSSTKPTRSGYKFLGWSTYRNATSASYQPGTTYTHNANIYLYAVWEQNALNGWVQQSGKWYYYHNDAKATGWLQVGGTWYYFNASGAMVTGWLQSGSTWYYFNSSGAMVTGWQRIGGTWYYFTSSGAMATGWLQSGNTWYYFNSSGAMVTGWLQIGGTWYCFKTSGAMATGWLQVGGTWYYLKSSGAMQTGWLKIGNTWYYFHSSGAMATSPVTLGGKTYRFDFSGACLNP